MSLASALTPAQIQTAYVVFFGRPADADGLAYWSGHTGGLPALHALFAASPEYASHFAGLSPVQQVSLVYRNLLNREPDAEGLAFWSGALGAGTLTTANLSYAISTAALNPNTHADPVIQASANQDRLTVANRVTAATNFTAALDTAAERDGYSGPEAVAAARAWLAAVTHATPSANLSGPAVDAAVAAAVAAASAPAPVPVPATSLTPGLDRLLGTASADTIPAIVDSNPSINTLNSGDVIAGGAGQDTLAVTVRSNFAGFTGGGSLEGVEVLRLTSDSIVASNFSLIGATKVNEIHVAAPAGMAQVNISDLGFIPSVVSVSGLATTASSTFDVGFQPGVTSGAADALTIAVRDSGNGETGKILNVHAAGIENVTIDTSGGGWSRVGFNAADARAVTISGTGMMGMGPIRTTHSENLTVTSTTSAFLGIDSIHTVTGNIALNIQQASKVIRVGDVVAEGANVKMSLNGSQEGIGIGWIIGNNVEINTHSAVQSALQIEAIAAAQSVAINASPMTVTMGATSDRGHDLDIVHVATPENSSLNVTLNGGLLISNYAIFSDAATRNITVSGNLGQDLDTVQVFDSTSTGLITIDTTALASTQVFIFTGDSGSVVRVGTNSSDLQQNAMFGGAGVDNFTGGSGFDRMYGLANADIFTGGAGRDGFGFITRADTRSAGFSAANTSYINIDHITDFSGNGAALGDFIALGSAAGAFGSSALAFNAPNVAANVTAVTIASASDFAGLISSLAWVPVSTAGVAQILDVTVSGGSLAGRVMVINDDVAGIQASDTFINITGISGNLHASDFAFV